MGDIFKSFIEHQKERVSHPFIGAFITTFITYNWDIFYYMWSSESDSLIKIKHVKEELFKSGDFLTPLFYALLLMFLPALVNAARHYVNDRLDNYRLKRKSELELSRAENDSKIAYAKAERAYATQKVELEVKDNIAGIIRENEALNSKIEQLNQSKQQLNKVIEDYNANLTSKDSLIASLENEAHNAREAKSVHKKAIIDLEFKLKKSKNAQKIIYDSMLSAQSTPLLGSSAPSFNELQEKAEFVSSQNNANQIATDIAMTSG